MTPFSPVEPVEGYLPIEDHGLIGDGATAALVARDGSIPWLCVPRFDSPPLLCGILDRARGGAFVVSAEEALESRQRYMEDTGVLVTEIRTAGGMLEITDALTLRAGADLAEDAPACRQELVRVLRAHGPVEIRVELDPRGGATAEPRGGGLQVRCHERPELDLHLSADRPLEGLGSRHRLEDGEEMELLLTWSGSPRRDGPGGRALLEETVRAWRSWMERFRYDGIRQDMVRRSAVTLKLLDHFANGAIVAAPTSSLPEAIGGRRNWDYRYSWIRDAAFSVYALRRIGLAEEAWGFLSWVLDAVERSGRPKVLYDLDGGPAPEEREDPGLEGYRRSAPVRWGNAAADQEQQDVYGEILDCAYQWIAGGGELHERLWGQLSGLVEDARRFWHRPGHGIWEVRTEGKPFTYSAALCQVALDRGARIAQRAGLPAPVREWTAVGGRIREAIIEEAWNPEIGALSGYLGGRALDASLLSLPLRRVLAADHPKMQATTEAIRRQLDAGEGLLYRYLPEELPDGLPPGEGAFLLCSFWLADNLAHQGRLDEAIDLYESLCRRANPLGLLPEQIDPSTGAFLGNFPQAFSHVGLIATGFKLSRLTGTWTPEWWQRAFGDLPD